MDSWRINHHGRHTVSDDNRTSIPGVIAVWSLSPTASILAGEAEGDMAYARIQRKCELADFAVGRQPAVADLNC
jgi:hypothetical protein